MSYDIYIKDKFTGETLKTDHVHQLYGGTYCANGTDECWFNMTYNYCKILNKAFNVKYWKDVIDQKDVCETLPLIKEAINRLGDDVDDDYWKETEGNVKVALNKLYSLGYLRPDGIWSVE